MSLIFTQNLHYQISSNRFRLYLALMHTPNLITDKRGPAKGKKNMLKKGVHGPCSTHLGWAERERKRGPTITKSHVGDSYSCQKTSLRWRESVPLSRLPGCFLLAEWRQSLRSYWQSTSGFHCANKFSFYFYLKFLIQ